MKLLAGCGQYKADGWVSIDIQADVGADVTADLRALPFHDESVEDVYLGHVLEHIPFADVPVALTEVWRVLKPGGAVAIVGPDIDAALTLGTDPQTIDGIVAGPDGPPGAGHQWTASAALTLYIVRRAIPDASQIPLAALVGWPVTSFAPWQCAVIAQKGPAT